MKDIQVVSFAEKRESVTEAAKPIHSIPHYRNLN